MREKALKIIQKIEENKYEAYFVGGFVRDHLLGRLSKDIDITTSATPEEIMRIFPKNIPTGLKHGTVTVEMDGELFEITTFRTDGKYLDSRRPEEVIFVSDLEEDLKRRDFTINAMAINQFGDLIDPFNGYNDLVSGIIKCVGNPDKRFEEDALRMLRAIRFSFRYNFSIEEETLKSIYRNRKLISNISAERIHMELQEILSYSNRDLSILEPLLKEIFSFEINIPKKTKNNYLLNYALLSNEPLKLAQRLKVSHLEKIQIQQIHKYINQPIGTRHLLKEAGYEIAKIIISETKQCSFEDLEKLNSLPNTLKDLPVNGTDLIELGYTGKEIGLKLEELLEKQLNCENILTKEELLKNI